jgi:hypothetical protein
MDKSKYKYPYRGSALHGRIEVLDKKKPTGDVGSVVTEEIT